MYYWVIRKIGKGADGIKFELASVSFTKIEKANLWLEFLDNEELHKTESKRFRYSIVSSETNKII